MLKEPHGYVVLFFSFCSRMQAIRLNIKEIGTMKIRQQMTVLAILTALLLSNFAPVTARGIQVVRDQEAPAVSSQVLGPNDPVEMEASGS